MKAVNRIQVLLKKLLSKESPKKEFRSYHYQRHNQRVLEHLASLGLNIADSTVLELGAGIGDHTSFFLDRSCQVVTSDVRQETLKILQSRYPYLKVIRLDLDSPPGEFFDLFDIVYCYGLLYHLENPAKALEFMSRCCRKTLLLETCVSFGDEESLGLCTENLLKPSQSVSGIGCRPTRKWVYKQLKRHFEFVYLPITQPNHEEFPIDWTHPPAKQPLIRAVFIASRQKLINKLLVETIPLKQIRH